MGCECRYVKAHVSVAPGDFKNVTLEAVCLNVLPVCLTLCRFDPVLLHSRRFSLLSSSVPATGCGSARVTANVSV